MNELNELRKKIDQTDAELLKLFEARMDICKSIAEIKLQYALPVRDAERENAVILKNSSAVKDSVQREYYTEFLRKTINLSCAYQERLMNGLKVGYSGVEGAFAYIAAKKMYPFAKLCAYKDFEAAYAACENGDVDAAVLPVENSYAGEVGTVMDLMFSGGLYINKVVDLDIIQNLIAPEGATTDTIKTVVSHPQALTQCDEFIKSHGYEILNYSNTAAAADYVKQKNDITVAAIASDDSAELFGLTVVASGINQSKNNTTRFASFSRALNTNKTAAKSGDEGFVLMFTVKNEAGSLAQTLNILGAHGYNMRSLRSRPMKNLMWSYFFYLEAEGSINTQNGKDMLNELSAVCAKLKLAGSFEADMTV